MAILGLAGGSVRSTMHGVDILEGDDALTGEFLDENLRVVRE